MIRCYAVVRHPKYGLYIENDDSENVQDALRAAVRITAGGRFRTRSDAIRKVIRMLEEEIEDISETE